MRERERSSMCCFTPQMDAMTRAGLGWSQAPWASSRCPNGCRGPGTWTIFCYFPNILTESWIQSRTTGTWTGTHMGSGIAGGSFICNANQFLGIYSKELNTESLGGIFTAAFFTTVKRWEQHIYMHTHTHTHIMEYYSAFIKKEISLHGIA